MKDTQTPHLLPSPSLPGMCPKSLTLYCIKPHRHHHKCSFIISPLWLCPKPQTYSLQYIGHTKTITNVPPSLINLVRVPNQAVFSLFKANKKFVSSPVHCVPNHFVSHYSLCRPHKHHRKYFIINPL